MVFLKRIQSRRLHGQFSRAKVFARQAIQQLEQRIVTEWLPTSGYEYDNGPDVELYISPDPQNAKFEVWIPVVKKQ